MSSRRSLTVDGEAWWLVEVDQLVGDVRPTNTAAIRRQQTLANVAVRVTSLRNPMKFYVVELPPYWLEFPEGVLIEYLASARRIPDDREPRGT